MGQKYLKHVFLVDAVEGFGEVYKTIARGSCFAFMPSIVLVR